MSPSSMVRRRSGLYVPRAGGGGGGGGGSFSSLLLARGALEGYWKMDETSGTTAADASTHARNGTYTSSPTLGASPLLSDGTGKAMTVASNSGSCVTVASASWMNLTTISAGVIASITSAVDATNGDALMSRYAAGGLSWLLWRNTAGFLAAQVYNNSGSHADVNTGVGIVSGRKYLVGFTFDGTNIKIYVNGALAGTTALTGTLQTATSDLEIARASTASGTTPGATLDEAFVTSDVISATDWKALAVAAQAGTYDAAVLADTPLLYWKFAEVNGTVALDASGNGHEGVIAAGISMDTAPVMPSGWKSINLNGVGQYVKMPVASWLNQAAWTVEGWFYLSAVSSYHNMFNRDGTSNRGWNLYTNGTEFDGFDGSADKLTSGAGLAVNTPYHMAITCDGSNLKYYLNGVLKGTQTPTVGWLANAASGGGAASYLNDFIVGASLAGTGTYQLPANALADHIAYYGAVLSGTRLAAHYAAA